VRGERVPVAGGERDTLKQRYVAFPEALDQWSKETS
jgi:hypothetical protein